MSNIHSNLNVKLDYLIGLLDISSKESFDKIKEHKITAEFESVGEIYNNQFSIYKNQITISAILLGYGYLEAFLADLMVMCLKKQPKILIPEGKLQNRDKTITYQQFLLANSYETLVYELIEKEVRNVMYKSMREILDYLEKKLKLKWDHQLDDAIIIANRIRNCFMHNNCIADKNLSKDPRFKEAEEIELRSGIVHSFGLKARQFTRELWDSAKKHYSF